MYLSANQAKDYKIIRYLAEQTISEPISSIHPLKKGITSYNFEINHHLIFKLPGLTTPTESWINQVQCAPFLQKYFSFQIPKPCLHPVLLSATSGDCLLSLTYEKIPGRTLSSFGNFSKKERSFKENYFNQLAQVARQIHAIPPEILPTKIPTTEEFLKGLCSKIIGGITFNQDKVLDKIIHSSYLGFPESLKLNTLCHCDLRAANICLNNKNQITGVLDFDSLNRGISIFEFHPYLYGANKHEEDTRLFYQTYCREMGCSVDKENFNRMRRLFWALSIFSILCKFKNEVSLKRKIDFLIGYGKTLKNMR